jgi:hypothetical protein
MTFRNEKKRSQSIRLKHAIKFSRPSETPVNSILSEAIE